MAEELGLTMGVIWICYLYNDNLATGASPNGATVSCHVEFSNVQERKKTAAVTKEIQWRIQPESNAAF